MSLEINNSSTYYGLIESFGLKVAEGIILQTTSVDTDDGALPLYTYVFDGTEKIIDLIGGTESALVLPSAGTDGKLLIVKNSSSELSTIATSIDGLSNRILHPGDSIGLFDDSSEWKILFRYREVITQQVSSYPYSITTETFLLCQGTGNMSLPLSSDMPPDKTITVKNSGAGTLTINRSGSDLIDGAASVDILPSQALSFLPYSSGYAII
jgi:hypothetical protein